MMQLKLCSSIQKVRLNHISLGETGRAASVKSAEDFLSALQQSSCTLVEMELANTGCDILDLQIIRRQFPSLQAIKVYEFPELLPFDDSGDEADISAEEQENHTARLHNLRNGCLEDDFLNGLVTFHDM